MLINTHVYSHLIYFFKNGDEEIQIKTVKGLGMCVCVHIVFIIMVQLDYTYILTYSDSLYILATLGNRYTLVWEIFGLKIVCVLIIRVN